MEKIATHEIDGDNQWILHTKSDKFLIEFIINEHIIKEGYMVMHPIDKAHFEPSVIQMTASIEDSFMENEDGDWQRIKLTELEEQEVVDYIEVNYEI